MADQVPFGADAITFATNPEPRVACVVLVDVSGSMHGEPLDEVNAGLQIMKEELQSDALAAKRAEIAIVTFGGTVTVVQDFVGVERFSPPRLESTGDTPMGAGIRRAIELVQARKQVYKDNGIAYYRPWVFLITDGAPTDRWHDAAMQVQDGERQNAFVFFSVGTEDADFTILRKISKQREPLKLKGLRFRDLFQWLSKSLQSVSHSKMNESVQMENPVTASGWAEIPPSM